MDIENMHPFCLPFSLCHDATSSSIMDDSYNGKPTKLDDSSRTNINEETSRDDNTSLLDDSFDRLDGSDASQRSMENDAGFIGSSLSEGSHDVFGLLDLDMDMKTDDGFNMRDINSDDMCGKGDDWFSLSANHECPLLSPVDNITCASTLHHRSSLKMHLRGSPASSTLSAHNHHVFQHIVDPIDIKSSPTLAQLNLNSHDDPTDGLWDATSATTTTSTTSTLISSTAHHHHHHHLNSSNSDLLSSAPNCNGSTGTNPVMTGCSSGNLHSTCSHMNNHNQHQGNAAEELTHHHAAQLNNLHLHACQHHPYHNHHHHHHHHQQQASNESHSSLAHTHSTCLAVAPFRKSAIQLQRSNPLLPTFSGCCLNHSHEQYPNSNRNISTQSGITCPFNQKNDSHRHQVPFHHQCTTNSETFVKQQPLNITDKNHSQLQRSQQQRCQSPAPLVTSSSSPLSSSATQNAVTEIRPGGENKLKENIEYLTVLLCNGSKKLDKKVMHPPQSREQQSAISSSMVKSYSALTQSLATEPKLLERYQQIDQHPQSHQYGHPASLTNNNAAQITATNQSRVNGEVIPQCAMQIESQMSHVHGQKQICSNQCFKPVNVESSISAADSTAENQGPRTFDHMSTCYINQAVSNAPTSMDSSQVSRSSDMKVLSSLLNSNKCIGQTKSDPMANTGHANQHQTPCVAWSATCNQSVAQPILNSNNNRSHPSDSFMNGSNINYDRDDSSSIPINGRPITLTPLVSNNVSIPQRPPVVNQQINSKSKAPTFAQPTSPSTSSTASSSGNTEILPPPALTKKQRSGASGTGKDNNQSERSGRPSSMSTDCSLSSHDEGFSSQIDQDDCGNSVRDSDDESDIDSDDESFYGDYTNNDLIGASISDNPECKWTLNMGRTRRNGQRRFFWQYNVQSKGPKGTRICSTDGAEDPFVLPEASDPVFSNECQVEGVKHSGKARRGDGNDLTPNPRKLLMIGLELKKLSKIINELAPVTDLPMNARNKTRKEKNKLASRACRLKKKAQHEANKIKLYGLQREHQQIVMAIFDARKMIHKALTRPSSIVCSSDELSTSLKKLLEQCLMTVAGQTGDYVNSVLEKVVSGCIDGGLQT